MTSCARRALLLPSPTRLALILRSMFSTLIARIRFSSEVFDLRSSMSLERLARRRLEPLAFDASGVALRGGYGR